MPEIRDMPRELGEMGNPREAGEGAERIAWADVIGRAFFFGRPASHIENKAVQRHMGMPECNIRQLITTTHPDNRQVTVQAASGWRWRGGNMSGAISDDPPAVELRWQVLVRYTSTREVGTDTLFLFLFLFLFLLLLLFMLLCRVRSGAGTESE